MLNLGKEDKRQFTVLGSVAADGVLLLFKLCSRERRGMFYQRMQL